MRSATGYTCEVCGQHRRGRTTVGVCRQTPACANEYHRRWAAARAAGTTPGVATEQSLRRWIHIREVAIREGELWLVEQRQILADLRARLGALRLAADARSEE